MRFVIAVSFLLSPLTALAAPAPLVKRDRSGNREVILEARTAERARLARVYIYSQGFADELAKITEGEQLVALLPQHESIKWIKNRFAVTIDGSHVRIRVHGSRSLVIAAKTVLAGKTVDPKDPAVARARTAREMYSDRLHLMQRMRRHNPDIVTQEEVDATESKVAHYEFEAEPLKVRK